MTVFSRLNEARFKPKIPPSGRWGVGSKQPWGSMPAEGREGREYMGMFARSAVDSGILSSNTEHCAGSEGVAASLLREASERSRPSCDRCIGFGGGKLRSEAMISD